MPANPITTLTNRRVLNAIVNERIKPYTGLTNMLFPATTKQNLFEEFAQVDVLEGTYDMAPFVKLGQRSVIVASLNGKSYTIETPYINIERPMQHSLRLAQRQAGQNVFTVTDQLVAQVRTAIEQDVDFMNTITDDRIEWMIAFLLRGQIDYSVEGNDSFTINSGKPSANTFTVSNLWNAGSATPLEDITDMKKVVAARRGPAPNVGICGAGAAAGLRGMLENKTESALGKAIKTTSGIDVGRATLIATIEENGMIFIGEIGGVLFFEYTGIFQPDGGGTPEPFIRDAYIEYFSIGPRATAMRDLFFGRIPSLFAMFEGNDVTERYLASIAPTLDKDVYTGILKTRPLPWFKRPDWNVSMKVVA